MTAPSFPSLPPSFTVGVGLLLLLFSISASGIRVATRAALAQALLLAFGYPSPPLAWELVATLLGSALLSACLEETGLLAAMVAPLGRALERKGGWLLFLAPLISYLLAFALGSGNSVLLLLPLIVSTAKKGGIAPIEPLALSVVSAQLAVTTSPISALSLYLQQAFKSHHPDYAIPWSLLFLSGLVATVGGSVIFVALSRFKTASLPAQPQPSWPPQSSGEAKGSVPTSARKLWVAGALLGGLLLLGTFPTLWIHPTLGGKSWSLCERNLVIFMALVGLLMELNGGSYEKLAGHPTVVASLKASLIALSLGGLGRSFMEGWQTDLTGLLSHHPRFLSHALPLLFYLLSGMLFSQTLTALLLMPLLLQLKLPPAQLLACLPALSGVFLTPHYATAAAALAADETEGNREKKKQGLHPFFLPGWVMVSVQCGILKLLLLTQGA